MQELDAQRRLAILRGEAPPPSEDDEPQRIEDASSEKPRHRWSQPGGSRWKRKRPGEDDTDFELRVAKERNAVVGPDLASERKPTSSAPIVDHQGHIDLFGSERSRAHAEKNEEAEAEARKKKQSYEDQYTMRFTNAAGKEGLAKPWYSNSDMEASAAAPMKNAWGNADPKRRERDTQRMVSSDPLAMMKQGASKVRQLNQERKKFQDEREEELKQMRREERHREKRRRRHEGEGRSKENDSSSRQEEHRRRSRSRERSHRRGDEDGPRRRRSRDGERRRRHDSRSPDRERERHRRHHRNDYGHE